MMIKNNGDPLKSRVALFTLILFLFAAGAVGCATRGQADMSSPGEPPKAAKRELPRIGYTIQAGAFARVENAARLTALLRDKGLDATYFVAPTGLFKVQFGNFPAKEKARERAKSLVAAGVIEEYYIVSPGDYAVAKKGKYGSAYLRKEIVKTARSFLGVPYLWGGTSPQTGFDCSGLTMAVYQLNGLDLPRVSRDQFESGESVGRHRLKNGDLVFFSIAGNGRVSHVGIYVGRGSFIHAPGMGKNIRVDALESSYYSRRYLGARSYLD